MTPQEIHIPSKIKSLAKRKEPSESDILNYIFRNPKAKKSRVLILESRFIEFMEYYFPREFYHEMAPFQINYSKDLQNGEDIIFVGFRECAKSMILRYYYVWCICYRKKRFIMHYNDNFTKAKKMLLSVIIILEKNKKIIRDYGYLYIPAEGRKQRDISKKSVTEFITTNQVMMKAMSPGMSPRGETFYSSEGETLRPDLVGFDDLDTLENTKNPKIISEAVEFILSEVMGGLDAFAQKVFLGNSIREDGRVIRLKKHFESDEAFNIKIYWQKIREKGKIAWSRFVATDKIADRLNKGITNTKAMFISLQKKRREQGSIAYNGNFNLIPYVAGQTIIGKTLIKYWYSKPDKVRIVMGVDGALSEQTISDPMAVTITAHYTNDEGRKFKYILGSWKLEGAEKSEENYKRFISEKYKQFNVNIIVLESQGGGLAIGPVLRKEKLAVVIISATKDKTQRLMEFQGDFERGEVMFSPDKTGELETQLLAFPNATEDDMVDSMVYSFYDIKVGGFTSSASK
ncbi:hypothetical protein GW846_03230 [Candidatus Gracilibacteria bacterium]|nr:hypothetical protein [Candidatus Gracilibacteria bacterium]